METLAKILIADENTAQRQSLYTELRRAGYTNVEVASNGEDTLNKIEKYHPDVVIVDIWLSKLDGIGVLKNCQKINFGQDVAPSFIVMSLVSNQSIFVEATNAGAEVCIMKPYNLQNLLDYISTLIRMRRNGAASLPS